MAKNKITDLRDHLFAQIERLSDDEAMKNPIAREREVARANSIKALSDAVVSTVKVEIDYLKAMSDVGAVVKTDFIPQAEVKKIEESK